MLRRIGNGLGLLFVLACVAAYPLTWGGVNHYRIRSGNTLVWAAFSNGQLNVGTLRRAYLFEPPGFSQMVSGGIRFRLQDLYRVRIHWFPSQLGIGGFTSLPLWMPALAASLFMAWR